MLCKQLALYSALIISLAANPAAAWDAYGGDAGGSKYSHLKRINRDNVAQLEQAWVYQSGGTGEGYRNGYALTFEATPVFWQDTLFFNSSFGKAYAVWHFARTPACSRRTDRHALQRFWYRWRC